MYHRIARPRVDPWQLAVAPERFTDQIHALRRHFDLLPLDQIAARLAAGRTRRPAVAITFDDGYLDNLTVARPILESAGCTATVFVATGFIDDQRPFWWDRLADLVLGRRIAAPVRVDIGDGGPDLWPEPDLDGGGVLLEALWRRMRLQPPEERSQALDRLADLLGCGPPDAEDRPMSADEIASLAPVIGVGAHTVTHPSLPALPSEAREREIIDSRRRLEAITGGPVDRFAYPFGDVDDETCSAARRAGVALAFTTRAAAVRPGFDPLRVPRLHVNDWSGEALVTHIRRLCAS